MCFCAGAFTEGNCTLATAASIDGLELNFAEKERLREIIDGPHCDMSDRNVKLLLVRITDFMLASKNQNYISLHLNMKVSLSSLFSAHSW